ncbi:MAG: hypothetical protein ACD_72C00205G0002 [uncultured bacterium]|nr:MAG: hypothetical protein ACD_72C00205G0002 [uncultured bacterium]
MIPNLLVNILQLPEISCVPKYHQVLLQMGLRQQSAIQLEFALPCSYQCDANPHGLENLLPDDIESPESKLYQHLYRQSANQSNWNHRLVYKVSKNLDHLNPKKLFLNQRHIQQLAIFLHYVFFLL